MLFVKLCSASPMRLDGDPKPSGRDAVRIEEMANRLVRGLSNRKLL